MSGVRQHHVWKALQNGFSWKEHGDNQIWVHRKGTQPEQTVTRKFGFEKRFYGDADSAADKNITSFENTIQGFIQDVRLMGDGQEVDAEKSAALISHLEVRSQFFREQMSRLGERAALFIQSQISSRANYRKILSTYLENHPELLAAELENAGIPEEMRSFITEKVAENIPVLIENSHSNVRAVFDLIFNLACTSLAAITKEAHNKSLTLDFSEIERTENHRKMRYTVFRSPQANLILPDTCLAFFLAGSCRPISQKSDVVESVVVPVSSSVAIVGSAGRLISRESDLVNRALASCAFEAFLASSNTSEMQGLSNRIGKNARLLSESEIQRAFQIHKLLKDL
jgi:hypothetical protein